MIGKISKFRTLSALFATSLVLVLGGTLWAYFALRGATSPIILHFNNLAGINQVGGASEFLLVGLGGLIVVVVNLFLAFELEERDRILGKMVTAATLLFSLLFFIGFAAIISVN